VAPRWLGTSAANEFASPASANRDYAYSLIGNKLSGQFHRVISESVNVKLVKLTSDPGVSVNQ
jgi:hypothetical protein